LSFIELIGEQQSPLQDLLDNVTWDANHNSIGASDTHGNSISLALDANHNTVVTVEAGGISQTIVLEGYNFTTQDDGDVQATLTAIIQVGG
jgi:hypothetical protein